MRNYWWLSCLFLVSILLLSNRLVTGNDKDDGDLFDVARKASASADKDLCQNTPGCTCDGKNEQVNCTCIINKQRNLLKQVKSYTLHFTIHVHKYFRDPKIFVLICRKTDDILRNYSQSRFVKFF